MKKYVIAITMLFALFALVACNGNGDIQEPATTQTEDDPPTVVSEETPTANLPTEELEIQEELKIQIDAATDELLSTFTHLYHADVRSVYGHVEGATLVIWANQTLSDFSVLALATDFGEDTLGFRPTYGFGSVSVFSAGEAFVIENYMGLGTFAHRGISFYDSDKGATRVFFFQENHAYPEHGGQWIIQEIESDRLIWGFSYDVDFPSEVIINGVPFNANEYSNAEAVYTVAGQLPTHITMSVLWELGLDAISAGSQIELQQNGSSIGVGLSIVNYLAVGGDRVALGIDDTFMADDGYFTTYIPISLIKALGFDVYFEGSYVHIDGQLDVAINPHPLAVALQHFIAGTENETKALVAHVNGAISVVAIEFVDGFFAEATLFVHTGLEVISKEIGSIEGFPFSIGFDGLGNLVKVSGDGGNASYTMLGVATNPATSRDEIVYLFTIYAERADDESIHYYRFDGGWLEGIEGGRHSITEEEFYAIRNGMGDRISSWREFRDETESILAWADSLQS